MEWLHTQLQNINAHTVLVQTSFMNGMFYTASSIAE